MRKLKVNYINIVIDCADAGLMADFYSRLLGWEWTHPQANGWAAITSPTGTVIAFQEVEGYEPRFGHGKRVGKGRCFTSICGWMILTRLCNSL